MLVRSSYVQPKNFRSVLTARAATPAFSSSADMVMTSKGPLRIGPLDGAILFICPHTWTTRLEQVCALPSPRHVVRSDAPRGTREQTPSNDKITIRWQQDSRKIALRWQDRNGIARKCSPRAPFIAHRGPLHKGLCSNECSERHAVQRGKDSAASWHGAAAIYLQTRNLPQSCKRVPPDALSFIPSPAWVMQPQEAHRLLVPAASLLRPVPSRTLTLTEAAASRTPCIPRSHGVPRDNKIWPPSRQWEQCGRGHTGLDTMCR